jgi:hypothetical protein
MGRGGGGLSTGRLFAVCGPGVDIFERNQPIDGPIGRPHSNQPHPNPIHTRPTPSPTIHPTQSRGRRFWAALHRAPLDPISNRPICFAYNRGLIEGAGAGGGCLRSAERCRFAHVPLSHVPGAEEASAILSLEVR